MCEHQLLLLVGWLSTLWFEVRPSVWTSVVIVGGLVSYGLLIGCLSSLFQFVVGLLVVGGASSCVGIPPPTVHHHPTVFSVSYRVSDPQLFSYLFHISTFIVTPCSYHFLTHSSKVLDDSQNEIKVKAFICSGYIKQRIITNYFHLHIYIKSFTQQQKYQVEMATFMTY